jgi:hypothetical protein
MAGPWMWSGGLALAAAGYYLSRMEARMEALVPLEANSRFLTGFQPGSK